MEISGCTPCFYGGIEAMRAFQRKTIEDDQLAAILAESRKKEKDLNAESLKLRESITLTQKNLDNILLTAIDPTGKVRLVQETLSSTRGSIINISV